MGSGADRGAVEKLLRESGEPCGRCERQGGECSCRLMDVCKYSKHYWKTPQERS